MDLVINDAKYPVCMNGIRCFLEDLEMLIHANDNNIQSINELNKIDNEYYRGDYNIH